MASITSWTRLEPRTERHDLEDGLAARLHDPLWQLARQWQIGEFTGEDAGSPVAVRVRVEQSVLHRFRAGPDGEPASSPVNSPICHCRASCHSGSWTRAARPSSRSWRSVRGSSRVQLVIDAIRPPSPA